jgi:hypothetical protein
MALAIIRQSPEHGRAPTAAARSAPLSVTWFESEVVVATPKIRQKVGHSSQNDTFSVFVKTTEPEALPCPGIIVSSSDDASVMSQMYASKLDTPPNPLASTKESQMEVERPGLRKFRQTSNSNEQPHLLHKKRAKHETRSGPPSSSSRSYGEESTPVSVSESNTDSTVDSEIEYSSPGALDLIQARKLTNNEADTQIESSVERQYTMRQLARMALVSANGSRMTTSQILLWIAQTFSHLRIGQSGWEKSVRACLSRFEEFNGQEIAGAHGNKKLYGFSDTETRKRYETEYAGIFAASTSHSVPAQKAARENKKRSTGHLNVQRAVKSAPSQSFSMKKQANSSVTAKRHERHGSQVQSKQVNIDTSLGPLSTKELANLYVVTEQPVSNSLSDQTGNNTMFNPFERSVPWQPSGLLNLDHNVKRETTFQAAFADLQPSIETMAEAEKAQKIAEIKARPSRKKYFGSDYRLAHKRRHGLADIHDERHGAWKPQLTTDEQQRRDVNMDEEKVRNLREMFDLPDNMIPMNDGQTELAFRDGTLVSN